MGTFRWLVVFSLLLVSGYLATQVAADEEQTTPNSVELTVDFSFEEKHRCSRISPEISVSGIPAGTKSLMVKLKKVWTGGPRGEWKVINDGSGIIPAGSLKSDYFGPCPPKGSHLRYQFTVKAVSEDGKIIGIGNAEDNFSTVKYNPVANPAKLMISFADPDWNGEQIPTGQQCQRFGGNNPSTPRLMIQGIPPEANAIIMEYSDRNFPPMDSGGHGKIGYRISQKVMEIIIPSVPGHSFDMPKGFFIVSPHQAPNWDKAGAYQPPCSGGRGNAYYVTVNAVFQETPESKKFKLLGQAVLELGKY